MKPPRITIKQARDIGRANECAGVVICGIQFGPGGQFQIVTWGKSKAMCGALRGIGEAVAGMIENDTLELVIDEGVEP